MKRSGHYVLQPADYKAFIPTPLPPELRMDEELLECLSNANISLGRLDTASYLLPNLDHIIAMYVCKEALLSSQIEGTQASLEDIFQYESHLPLQNLTDVQEVVNYIKALNYGMKRLEEFPMSLRLIKEVHAILLDNTRGKEKTPGEFKRSQNWIGPQGCNLNMASFVPPPPHEAIKAMGDLELFFHKDNKLPLLIACALIHYQFETIHPFLDGNGRLGRLLITFYLYWKKVLHKPLLYLSYYFKINRQEYYDRLNLVRTNSDYEGWILFFLKGVIWTAESALTTTKNVLQIAEKHKKLLLKHHASSPQAIMLLDYLFLKPHLSIKEIASHFKLSYQMATSLVAQFEKLGIIKEVTGGKRNRRYSYWEYLACLSEGTR